MKYGPIPENLIERAALMAGKVPVPALDALFSLMKARALMAGVKLGIFDAMREGEHTPGGLARRLELDEDAVEFLLRALVHCDYLTHRGGRFALSSLGRRTMTAGAAMELREFVLWNYSHWNFIEHLEELVRTGRGVDFHETLVDPAAWQHYQRAMLELARLDAPLLARRVSVPRGATRLLDLAGSHGLLGAAICRRHPPMRSTVVELPQAIDHARVIAHEEGIDDLVEHRTGNLLTDDLGHGFDVALLANILHHFRPDQNQHILSRVRRAVRDGGTVAIWDLERPRRGSKPGDGDAVALFFRLTSTASVYPADEYAGWLHAAGFSRVRVVRPALSPGGVLVTGR